MNYTLGPFKFCFQVWMNQGGVGKVLCKFRLLQNISEHEPCHSPYWSEQLQWSNSGYNMAKQKFWEWLLGKTMWATPKNKTEGNVVILAWYFPPEIETFGYAWMNNVYSSRQNHSGLVWRLHLGQWHHSGLVWPAWELALGPMEPLWPNYSYTF